MIFIKSVNVLTLLIVVIIIFAENSNTNQCISEIRDIGNMDLKFNGQDAFRYTYLYMSLYKITGIRKSYLYSYVVGLYNIIVSNFNAYRLEEPMFWCAKSLRSDDSMDFDEKKTFCDKEFKKVGFNIDDSIRDTFHYAYFQIVPSKLEKGMGSAYYEYMLKTILPFVEESRAVGPIEYCDNGFKSTFVFNPNENENEQILYTECIDQLTDFGMLDRHFNGRDAFAFAYNNLNVKNTIGKNRDILNGYFRSLYTQITSIVDYNIIEDPVVWCLNNISKKKKECKVHVSRMGFKSKFKAFDALQFVYFETVPKRMISPVALQYFEYMLQTILPSADTPRLFGPEQYCNEVYKQQLNVFKDQSQLTDSTQIPNNQTETAEFELPPTLTSDKGKKASFDYTRLLDEQSQFEEFELPPTLTSDKGKNVPLDYTRLLDEQSQLGDFSFSKEYESYNSYNAAFNVPFGYIPDNNMSNPSYPTQFFNEQSFPADISNYNPMEQNWNSNRDSNLGAESTLASNIINPNDTNRFIFDQNNLVGGHQQNNLYTNNDSRFSYGTVDHNQYFNPGSSFAAAQGWKQFPDNIENYSSPSSSSSVRGQSSYHMYDNYPYRSK